MTHIKYTIIAFLQWEGLYVFNFHGAMAGIEVKEKNIFSCVF